MTLSSLIDGAFERLVSGNPRLGRMLAARSRKLAGLLASSGRTGDAQRKAKDALRSSIICALVFIPAGALASLFWWPLSSLCVLPATVYFLPELQLRDATAARKEGVERELPFFSVLVNVLGGSGVSLYSIMEAGIGSGNFESMEREAMLLRRDVVVFGANPVEALERLAANHPSRRFADFIVGYCSKVRSGGDVPGYLYGESAALLGRLETAWGRYAARVGTVGSLMVTIFGVIPLMLLVVGFFSPGNAVVGLGAFALVAVPLLSLALVVLSERMLPVRDDPLRGSWMLAVVVSVPGIVPGLLLGQVWLEAAIPLFTFCTVYGLSVRKQGTSRREEEEALPGFLKDLLEFKRLEYDLGRSIVAVATNSKFARSFDQLIHGLSAKLRRGIPLDQAEPEPKTRLGRMVFFVLGQMAYSGGGSVDTMYQLAHYTSRVVEMKEETKAEVRPYLLLSYVTPVLLAVGAAFVGGVLSNFGQGQGGGGYSGTIPLPIHALSPELTQVASLLIVVSAAGLGAVGAKMSDLTARNTLRPSVNIAIAVGATLAMPLLNIAALVR